MKNLHVKKMIKTIIKNINKSVINYPNKGLKVVNNKIAMHIHIGHYNEDRN